MRPDNLEEYSHRIQELSIEIRYKLIRLCKLVGTSLLLKSGRRNVSGELKYLFAVHRLSHYLP